MRPKFLKASIVVFAMIFGIFLFEAILRVVTPEPGNLAKLTTSSAFLKENKPYAIFPYISTEDGFNGEISINSFGFRDKDFNKEKTGGVFRIAVLGDSFEEALQVELDDTFQKILERALNEYLGSERVSEEPGGFKMAEVYNFGVSGYGTDEEWLVLKEKVWQFKPDMVILAFTPNDIGDTYKNKLVVLDRGKLSLREPDERLGGNWLGKLVRRTYLYHLVIKASSGSNFAKRVVDKIRVRILGFAGDEKFFLSDAQLVQGPFEIVASQKNPPDEVRQGWDVVKALILDMSKQATENNSKFLVTVNVSKMQVIPLDWEKHRDLYHLDPANSSPVEINKVLGEILSENSIDFYDPTEAAIAWYKEKGDLHYRRDAHFNKNGHLFMGEKVADFLIKEEIIK